MMYGWIESCGLMGKLWMNSLVVSKMVGTWVLLIMALKDGKLTYFMNNVELVGKWVMLVMALENGKMT